LIGNQALRAHRRAGLFRPRTKDRAVSALAEGPPLKGAATSHSSSKEKRAEKID
jgi:hypothetical protein